MIKDRNKLTPGPWILHIEYGACGEESYGIKAPAPYHWVIPPLNISKSDVELMIRARNKRSN